jgi:uracil-DNA glycosylase
MSDKDGIVRPFHRGLLVQPNCDGCPLQGEKIIPPEGDPTADVVIVGESPGYNEVQQGRPFVGVSGKFLDILLDRAGAERGEFWITNSILCRPKTVPQDNGELLSPDQVVKRAAVFCRSRLIAELQQVKPKSIIGLGGQSVRSVFHPTASMKGRRGGIHTIDLQEKLNESLGVKT